MRTLAWPGSPGRLQARLGRLFVCTTFMLCLPTVAFAEGFVPDRIAVNRCNYPKFPISLYIHCFGPSDGEGKILSATVGVELTAEFPIQYTVTGLETSGVPQFSSRSASSVVSEAFFLQATAQLGFRFMFLGDYVSLGLGLRWPGGLSRDISLHYIGTTMNGIGDVTKVFPPSTLDVSPVAITLGLVEGMLIASIQRYSFVNDDNRLVSIVNGQRFEVAPDAPISSGWLLSIGVEPLAIVKAVLWRTPL